MNAQEKAFVEDLKAVMTKHGVTLHGSDDYDGEDNYTGTSFAFISETLGDSSETTIGLSLNQLHNELERGDRPKPVA